MSLNKTFPPFLQADLTTTSKSKLFSLLRTPVGIAQLGACRTQLHVRFSGQTRLLCGQYSVPYTRRGYYPDFQHTSVCKLEHTAIYPSRKRMSTYIIIVVVGVVVVVYLFVHLFICLYAFYTYLVIR